MPIEAVIFDCDGTLVDSETVFNQVLVDYIAEFGAIISPEEAAARFIGRKLAHCLADIETQLGHPLPDNAEPILRQRTAVRFQTDLRPMPCAAQTLQLLTLPFCVASSGPREKIELTLGLTGLLSYFQNRIFSSYEIGTWKPDPGLFLHAATALNISPAHCAVVEDSQPGIEAGLAAGMRVFAFRPHPTVNIPPPPAVWVIHHLSELPSLLLAKT